MKKEKPEETVKEERLTYEDYAALPDVEGVRYELVDGVLELLTPSPTSKHQMISARMQFLLTQTCDEDYLILDAPMDVILSPYEVRQPDLIMVHRSRISIVSKRGIEGPPDLVVEILSPYSVKRDKVGKLKTYEKYGIPEFWIVEASGTYLEQYVLKDTKYELVEVFTGEEPVRSERLPCVSFTMNDILSRIPDLPD
ncbi:Uma2 family endonuclease [Effusibacillus lacus]|uniref:Transcriptional regulator n=1 Tax=Effusibacillus lacus TaxID=1348429 RepID=A0A292YI05_9BACL|nr:Uma2 family endonuclease [Effusibacillus lacus]TCS74588.1 Uma2 family endonuclease [Effusibacillus lacus]GAX88461.1 transcriptional regulator [Effusibacillus lacus]